jgi:hypothetical protein
VNELRKLLGTTRGKAFAAGWGVVILALVGFGAIYLSAGTGTGAVKAPPIVHHPHKDAAPQVVAGHPEISSKVPTPLAAKLIDHEVLVVQFYDPGTPGDPVIDDREAHNEAVAGAAAAGVGFAGVDVNDDAQMRAVSTLLSATSDPSVYIIDRSGDILFQRSGYLDRDTLAQAASNALIGAKAADEVPAGPKDGIAGPYDNYWEAEADNIVCEARNQFALLPPATTALPVARGVMRAQVQISDLTVNGLRGVAAVGPTRARFLSLVGLYAQVAADQHAALAALLHAPPNYAALAAANDKIVDDTKARDDAAKKLGIACFDPPPKPKSGK